ncbi:MAG: sigma-70 family RNA polymerase sigma factor [Actinomycetota bacterium]|nr:sigma-70 family RNA polymerase sigma factor [Actinomycetota bacterium]
MTLPVSRSRKAGDEGRLIRSARAGSSEAAEALIERYWHEAYRAAYLVLHDAYAAEDVAQEAMIAALETLPRFRLGRRFGPWLHRITVNQAIDASRKTQRSLLHEAERGSISDSADGDSDVIEHLARLDHTDRSIVVLRHVFAYRSAEIARMLDLPASTVRTRLQRALEQLRKELT